MNSPLLTPVRLGALQLKNRLRLVMAPLPRIAQGGEKGYIDSPRLA